MFEFAGVTAIEGGTEGYLGVEGVTVYFVAVFGALFFDLAVVVVNESLFVGVDLDSEFGGCVGFVFEVANFVIKVLVRVGGLLEEDTLCFDMEGWKGEIKSLYMCCYTNMIHREYIIELR